MMSAPSLPAAQTPMPQGFAPSLTAIGQLPADGGEAASFDQLLAAAPAKNAVTLKIEAALPVEGGTAAIDAAPIETAAGSEAPAVNVETGEADAAAALAATLLITLNGSVAGSAPAPGKPVPAETEADTSADAAAPDEAGTAAPVAAWLSAIAATAPDKPAKPVESAAASVGDNASAAPIPAKARDAVQPAITLALTGAEPQAAKPADAAASMTVLFTQSAAQGAGTVAHAAQPIQIAERVLDLGSDDAWIDQLARDIAATKSQSGDISFRLMPRHLGRLDVAMQMGEAGMSLKMDTHHEATATIVTAAQGRLVEDLRQQGVRVAGAEVTCTPGETGRQSQGQGRAAQLDPAHLIETATERGEPRQKTDSEDRAGDRHGRFA